MNWVKRIVTIGVLIGLVSVLVNYHTAQATAAASEKLGPQLLRAFQSSGAQATGYAVHDWTIVNHQFLTMDDLQKIAVNINQDLQIPDPQEDRIADNRQNVYQLHGNWAGGQSVSIVLTSLRQDSNVYETTLVIRVEKQSNDISDYSNAILSVQRTLSHVKGNPNISTCIQGFLGDRMTNVDKNRLIEKMLSAVNAHEVEGIRTDLVSSISGYSNQIPTYIVTNGKKMNLQVAVHDDAAFHTTRIVVGMPIITVTY